jgi:hypothetical protein
VRGWAQDGALLLFGKFPGLFRGHAQFAIGLVGLAMESRSFDVRIGDIDFGDLFAGEKGRDPGAP